jgi:hypothetical protein
MRYLFITYYRKPSGQWDEAIQLARRVRTRDLQMVNIIMDFQDLKIVKSHVPTQTVSVSDWDSIHDYYHQHYPHIFERLHRENGRIPVTHDETDPMVTATNTAE